MAKIDGRFPVQIGITLVALGGLAAYPLARFGSEEIILAVLAGAALSTVNAVLGYLSIEYAFDKSYTTFLKVVVGGMGLRMIFMLGALVFLIRVLQVHALALMVSILGFYIVYLVLEILFIQRKMAIKNQR